MEAPPRVALITARKDSVRLPLKNRRAVGGLPLWRRSVEFALNVNLTPVVDSDDELILELAEELGHATHLRRTPTEAEGGTHWQAIIAAAEDFKLRSFILLQPTSPFRSAAVLSDALAAFDGSRPVLTCSTPGHWDGNLGVYPFPDPTANAPTFVRNPFAYSLQVDTAADLDEARDVVRWIPERGLC